MLEGIKPMMPTLPASIDPANDDMLIGSKAEAETRQLTAQQQPAATIILFRER